ncbi:MAG: hypothetical protein KAT68_12820 [Bacteroidales bacterium]|nr:hypothetical protein [Bacteroidales bacterium]
MNRYVKQLIEDIEKSISKVPEPNEIYEGLDPESDENDIEDMSHVEQYLNGEELPMEQYFGLEQELFPHVDKLTSEQIDMLTEAFARLWNAYHFVPDFPENLPNKIRYKLMREYLKHETTCVTFGEIHMEFCDYDEENCPFPGYCNTCKEIAADFEQNKISETSKQEEEELPDRVKNEQKENLFDIKKNNLLPTPEEAKKIVREKKKEEIKEIIKSPRLENHISGIHNYCDRWCEKCPYTKQCGSFALENKIYISDDEKDIQNEAFWDNLSLTFEATMELLEEKMKEFDITFEDEEIDMSFLDDETSPHPLEEAANFYAKSVYEWMDENKKEIELVLSEESFDKKKILNKDATETILWYHIFIAAKLNRAISGYYDKEQDEATKQDMNGSSKIALIAIERSISAWGILLQRFNHHEDDIFSFIKMLKHLQNKAKLMFPDAGKFIRPGFDE